MFKISLRSTKNLIITKRHMIYNAPVKLNFINSLLAKLSHVISLNNIVVKI